MDHTLTDSEIRAEAQLNGLIEPYDEFCLRGASYDLRAGEKAIITTSSEYKEINLFEQIDRILRITPGRTVVIYSYEKLQVPLNVKGRLSLRSYFSTKGLIMAGGLIDPGYKGLLFFGITNLSNSTVEIQLGDRIVTAEFTRLGNAAEHAYGDGQTFIDVPSEKLPPFSLPLLYDQVEVSAKLDLLEDKVEENAKRDATLIAADYMRLSDSLIQPFNPANVKGASYDLSIGAKIILTLPRGTLATTIQHPRQWIQLSDQAPSYEIPPQHSVTIYSHEKLTVPANLKGRLAIRSRYMAQRLNYDGGIVDPGYKGRLFFTMTNVGDSPVKLQYKDPIVSVEFVTLPIESTSYRVPEFIEDIDEDKLPPPPEGDYFGLVKLTTTVKSLDAQFQQKMEELQRKLESTQEELRPIQRITEYFFLALLAGLVIVLGQFLLDKVKDPNFQFQSPYSWYLFIGILVSMVIVMGILARIILHNRRK